MIFKKPILRSFGYGRVVRQTAKTLVKTQQDIVPTLLLLMCVGLSKGEGDMLWTGHAINAIQEALLQKKGSCVSKK